MMKKEGREERKKKKIQGSPLLFHRESPPLSYATQGEGKKRGGKGEKEVN